MTWIAIGVGGALGSIGLDTFVLARTHSGAYAVVNVIVQVVGGLIAVWLGYRLTS